MVLEATARRILFDDTKNVIHGLETDRGLILTPRIIFANGDMNPFPSSPVCFSTHHPRRPSLSLRRRRRRAWWPSPLAIILIRPLPVCQSLHPTAQPPKSERDGILRSCTDIPIDSPGSSALNSWPEANPSSSLRRLRRESTVVVPRPAHPERRASNPWRFSRWRRIIYRLRDPWRVCRGCGWCGWRNAAGTGEGGGWYGWFGITRHYAGDEMGRRTEKEGEEEEEEHRNEQLKRSLNPERFAGPRCERIASESVELVSWYRRISFLI